jgi:hypothetical protein
VSTIEQEFVCCVCGHEDVYNYAGEAAPAPEHCHGSMKPGQLRFPDMGSPKERRLHVVALQVKPRVDWSSGRGDYEHIFELWQLAPGRAKGERLGWIGCENSPIIDPQTGRPKKTIEFKLPTGVGFRDRHGDRHTGGFAEDVEHAAAYMIEAMEGGVHTGKYVGARFKSEAV